MDKISSFKAVEKISRSRMYPHKEIKDLLTFIGVCAPPDGSDWRVNFRYILIGVACLIILLAGVLSSLVVAIGSMDFQTSVDAAGRVIGCLSVGITIITGFTSRQKVKKLFSKLHQNYEQCNKHKRKSTHPNSKLSLINYLFAVKNDDLLEHLMRADRNKSQNIVKMLVKYFVATIVFAFSMKFALSLVHSFNWENGHVDANRLVHPYEFA